MATDPAARVALLRQLVDELRREPRPIRPLPAEPRILAAADAIDRLAPFAAPAGSPGAMRDPALVGIHLADGRATAGDGGRFARVLVDVGAQSRLYHADTGERLARQYPESFGADDVPMGEIARPVSTKALRAVAELALAARAAHGAPTWNPPECVALVGLAAPGHLSALLMATPLYARSEGHYVEACAPFPVSDYMVNVGTAPSYYDPRAIVDAIKGAAPLVAIKLFQTAGSKLVVERPDGERHLIFPLHPHVLTRSPAA